ncbi:MAG: hypothetical protein HC923_07490 [Myxococcales bacterium]|nr:hypothetical protein [Myxococcales bacterium]
MNDLDAGLAAFRLEPLNDAMMRHVLEAALVEGRPEIAFEVWATRLEALLLQGREEEAKLAAVEAIVIGLYDADSFDRLEEVAKDFFRRDPSSDVVFFGLLLELHRGQKWEELIDVLRTRLEVVDDEGTISTLHGMMAEILDLHLNRPQDAFGSLLVACRRSPSNLRLLSRLSDLGERLERHEDVVMAMAAMMMELDEPQLRAAICHRMAQLSSGR